MTPGISVILIQRIGNRTGKNFNLSLKRTQRYLNQGGLYEVSISGVCRIMKSVGPHTLQRSG